MFAANKIFLQFSLLISAGILFSCNNDNSQVKQTAPAKDSAKKAITVELPESRETIYQSPPIVNIVDTVAPKRLVIFCKDSAASFDRIGPKLANIYGNVLQEYIKKNNLKATGSPMAWYKKQQVPFFFEAGIPVNKKGSKPVPGVEIRALGAGNVVVAHFYGPFELLPQGYDAIKEFMKDNNKKSAGAPYEMYVSDPVEKDGKPKDPYKIQTDIVFPVKKN